MKRIEEGIAIYALRPGKMKGKVEVGKKKKKKKGGGERGAKLASKIYAVKCS